MKENTWKSERWTLRIVLAIIVWILTEIFFPIRSDAQSFDWKKHNKNRKALRCVRNCGTYKVKSKTLIFSWMVLWNPKARGYGR